MLKRMSGVFKKKVAADAEEDGIVKNQTLATASAQHMGQHDTESHDATVMPAPDTLASAAKSTSDTTGTPPQPAPLGMVRAKPPLTSSASRPSGTKITFTWNRLSEEAVVLNEHVLVFDASQRKDLSSPLMVCTKIPAPFLQAMHEWAKLGFMLSSRSDIEQEDIIPPGALQAAFSKRSNHVPLKSLVIGANEQSIAQTGKHGGYKSKISNRRDAITGNIPMSHEFVSSRNIEYSIDSTNGIKCGYNLLDNSVHSNFPADTKNITNAEFQQLINVYKATENAGVQDIRVLGRLHKSGGLLCISKVVEKYRKAPAASGRKIETIQVDGVVQTKVIHFIQRVESLHSILKNIARGLYYEANIKNGSLFYKDTRVANGLFHIKLLELIPAFADQDFFVKLDSIIKSIDDETQQNSKRLDLQRLIEINNAFCRILGEKQLYDTYCPIWHNDMPTMVRAAEDGYAVASDVDMLQIPGTFDLPAYVNVQFVTSMAPGRYVRHTLDECLARIKGHNFGAMKPSKLAKLFINNIEDACNFYENLSDDELKLLGTTSVYSMVIQYYFNEKLNVQGLKGTKMWMHAPESSNPGPEKLDASFSVWKDNFFYTGTEQRYLDYLLHDPEILKQAPLAINAAWLAGDTAVCSKTWLDVIEIQALQCTLSGYAVDDYFSYLYAHIDCPQMLASDPMPEIRATAVSLVQAVQAKVNEYIQRKTSRNGLESMIESLHKSYDSGCQIITDAMGNTKAARGGINVSKQHFKV